MRPLLTITFLLLLALTAGCRTAASVLTDVERASLTSVRLVPVEGRVHSYGKLPMEYEVDGSNGFMSSIYTAPIGVVYGLLNYKKTEERRARILRAAFHKAKVDVEAIVDRAIRRQFRKILPLEDPAPAVDDTEDPELDAGPRLEVKYHFGIESLSALDDGWMPWLRLDCTLTDEDGNVLWRDSSRLEARGELPFPDPFRDYKHLRRLVRDLARRETVEMRRQMLED